MLVYAHRGYHAKVPQNTLASFESAVALGADGIETDVRLSADGIPILFHDRCTRTGIEVSRLTHADLERVVGYSVPTLDSALAQGEKVMWNLEIKTQSAVEATLTILRRYHSARRFLVTSFLHPVVYEIVKLLDVEAGLLFAHLPADTEDFCPRDKNDPRITTLVWDYEACSNKLVARAAEHGYKNLVYGPITPSEHKEASSWMIEGVITDYPQLVK